MLNGLITLVATGSGERSAGNPHATFEAAGAGDGFTDEAHWGTTCPKGWTQRTPRPKGHRASSRPYVRPAKAGEFSRRQTCQGSSQSPVAWMAERREIDALKPIDEASKRDASEFAGRNESKRGGSLETCRPRGRALPSWAKAAGGKRKLACTLLLPWRGIGGSTRTRIP